MLDNKGGRGIKAKYPTKAMRVPEILESKVLTMIEELYEGSTTTKRQTTIEPHTDDYEKRNQLNLILPESQVLIEKCKDILLDKKSARLSLEKLLQFIYSDKEIKI